MKEHEKIYTKFVNKCIGRDRMKELKIPTDSPIITYEQLYEIIKYCRDDTLENFIFDLLSQLHDEAHG